MSALLGSIVGLGASIGTGVIDVIKKNSERKNRIVELTAEKELINAQADADAKKTEAQSNAEINKLRAEMEAKLKNLNAQGDIDESKQLLEHDKGLRGATTLIDKFSASVRPFITYTFFLMFILFKIILIWDVLKSQQSLINVANVIFDSETQVLFSAVVSFWFGSRTISKFSDRIGRQPRNMYR